MCYFSQDRHFWTLPKHITENLWFCFRIWQLFPFSQKAAWSLRSFCWVLQGHYFLHENVHPHSWMHSSRTRWHCPRKNLPGAGNTWSMSVGRVGWWAVRNRVDKKLKFWHKFGIYSIPRTTILSYKHLELLKHTEFTFPGDFWDSDTQT